MYESLMSERNFNSIANEEVVSPLEPDSPEYFELSFLFNTLFNESSGRFNSNDMSIYEIEKAYSLKNQFISLNFQKRQMNEITSYGWYELDNYEDKKTEEQVGIFRSKGLQKIKDEIKVSAPINKDIDRYTIIICKFIVGKSEIIFQDQELTDDAKKQYKNNYDTVVRILSSSNKKENIKNYNVLREENIELLYLVRAKKGEFQSQLIECSNLNCPNNELNAEITNKKESGGDKGMFYCLLKENYFCNQCHTNLHKEIIYGTFDVSRCEQKTRLNLTGECPNKEFHPNKKSFDIDYFCTDCLKGICSYCKVYGNEKHSELQLITDLFKEAKYKEKDKNISDKISKLNTKITSQQKENKDTGNELKAFLDKLIKDGLYNILNNKFGEEGEKLVSICYQLNFLKDNLIFYHKAYLNKENLCMSNNLKQELFWTKKMHMDNLLYLISIKDNIQTKYVVNIEEFKQIIDKYKDEMDKKINLEFGMIKPVEVKKQKEQNLITYENFIEITELKKNE